jgi:hypothetical protein
MAKLLRDKTRLALVPALVLAAACGGDRAVAPAARQQLEARLANAPAPAGAQQALALLRRATARYHEIDAALADGFVFFHGCEVRPGEGAVGVLYVHIERLMDGVIDPSQPDALVYEPARTAAGKPRLVAAELAVPIALWNQPHAPTFLGAEFQTEEEFGVYGLHVWIWRNNPEGLFAEANPHVSCGAE